MRKTVYIAHPVAGDVKGNAQKILEICSEIHTKNVIPVVPYLVSIQYLNDDAIEERRLGIEVNIECFHRGMVDEVWLYGERISPGMKEEVLLAFKLNIPVIPRTPKTERELSEIINKTQNTIDSLRANHN